MPGLVFETLSKVSINPAIYAKKNAEVTSGYRAYLIPSDVAPDGYAYMKVKVNTAATWKAEYTLAEGAEMEAGTHDLTDIFGANQTTSQDFDVPSGVSAVIVTLVSGSIDIVVRMK